MEMAGKVVRFSAMNEFFVGIIHRVMQQRTLLVPLHRQASLTNLCIVRGKCTKGRAQGIIDLEGIGMTFVLNCIVTRRRIYLRYLES